MSTHSKPNSSKRDKSESLSKGDSALVEAIKHYDIFYDQPPPGLIKEETEKPEDCIPDR